MKQKSIKKNTIFNTIKTISTIVFPLITFPYISRILLPENVGKFNFGLSIVSYYSLVASLGITTYAIRECSAVRGDREKLEKTASQIYSINVVTTVIAYIALAVTLAFYSKLQEYRLLIIILSLTIVTTTLGADWINSAMEDLKYITIRTVSFQIVSIVLMFAFVRKPEDYMSYAIISVISSVGASVMNIWYRKRYCSIKFTYAIDWSKHIKSIMLLFVMTLAQTVFHNIDTTMLGLQMGDAEVGIYSAAYKVFNIINQMVGSLLWVIMPRMAYYFEKGDYDTINHMLRKILNFNVTVGLPCVVGVIALSKEIIIIIAGNEYVNASPVLQILMIGFVFMLFGGYFWGNAILLPNRQERYYTLVCCVTACVNIITNYIFIPLWGAKAAACTTALSELVIFLLLKLKKNRKIVIYDKMQLMLPPLAGCISIVVICYGLQAIKLLWARTVASITLSVIAYTAIQLLMKNPLATELVDDIKAKYIL